MIAAAGGVLGVSVDDAVPPSFVSPLPDDAVLLPPSPVPPSSLAGVVSAAFGGGLSPPHA